MNPREHAEQGTRNKHIVKVRNQEQGIVHLKIHRRIGQDHAGQPACHEKNEEADEIDHWRGNTHPATIKCCHPVVDFDAGRHGDNHGGDAKRDIDAGALAHGEEMMQPHGKRDDGYGHGRDHKRRITV